MKEIIFKNSICQCIDKDINFLSGFL
jgi:hypothetical protein